MYVCKCVCINDLEVDLCIYIVNIAVAIIKRQQFLVLRIFMVGFTDNCL